MKPKLRLFSDGHCTYAEICGKSIGSGITSLNFSHDGLHSSLDLKINLEDFKFEQDDFFDEKERKYMEFKPPQEDNERLKELILADDDYAKTVEALASLVEARTHLDKEEPLKKIINDEVEKQSLRRGTTL